MAAAYVFQSISVVLTHSAEAIHKPLEMAQHAVEATGLTFIHTRHVPSQWLHENESGERIQRDLHYPKRSHQNHSAFSNAIMR